MLAQRNRGLLTVGMLATLWTAASGLQAIRSALHRAYGVEKGLPFWKAQVKVTLFTVIVGTGALAAFSLVVVMPYVWQLPSANAGVAQDSPVGILAGEVQHKIHAVSVVLHVNAGKALGCGTLQLIH